MRRGNVLHVTLTGLTLACATVAPVEAQRSPLERVEELARMGRPEEARGVLLEWWNDGRGEASRRELQRGLWLRGRLTVDPVQAELDYQRLVVLYPRGPFTPGALFRLAQGAHAMGDEGRARDFVATLTRDYAGAPETADAERWIRAAGPAPPPSDRSPLDRMAGQTTAPTDTTGIGRAVAAAARADDPPGGGTRAVGAAAQSGSQAAGNYFVQLGAFVEEARAMALFEEVSAAGEEARVVRVEGSRFLHVRIGRFLQRADAVDELERLTEVGINAALVRDERTEELIRS